MDQRDRIDVTPLEGCAIALVIAATGMIAGWALFGAPQLLAFALSDSKASDWCAVAVGIASAVAVVYLGRQANRLAKAPQDLHEADRRREARFLLAYLFSEVLAVKANANGFLHVTDADGGSKFLLASKDERLRVLDQTRDLDMPLARGALSRLHVLDAETCEALAKTMRAVQSANLAKPAVVRLENNEKALQNLAKFRDQLITARDNATIVMRKAKEAEVG